MLAAAGVALVHTLLGPDHYVPFVALAGAREWGRRRTAAITAACGAAHVVSSLLLGVVGLTLGLGVARLEGVEDGRGTLAAWALLAFGAAYALWGVRRALRRSTGITPHRHRKGLHVHAFGDRPHRHDASEGESPVTFWALLLVFVLGPCEPLIPLFVLPASRGRWGLALASAALFGVVTVVTMVAATLSGLAAGRRLPLGGLARGRHAAAGGIVLASGLAVLFLGL